ncbi:MAG TPA: calcium-binding protein [Solirubrobacterales bacterium]|nr:calcium-binding protein [Solirubrobacterales bacterium]
MTRDSRRRIGRGTRRAALATGVALVLLLSFGCTAASPQGEVVVRGAASGTHLELSMRGNNLIVTGWMAHTPGAGCRLPRRNLAVCGLAGVGVIEVDMGPSGDMVEVLEALPVPLIVHLGDGSDKFIGNGEPDTCYSEGARRNRCVGGGGNDICITGNQNSDCVGGDGNDYCQTGAGSDGCWGGPGNDICRMGAGQDGCHGEGGNDELYGGPSSDQLYGGPNYDHCDGLPGWGRSHECEAGPER